MSKIKMKLLMVVVLVGVFSSVSSADWDEGNPSKMDYVYLPDLSVNGTDVNVSDGLILIDDFICAESGLILDVHIWGSWLNDVKPNGDPDNVTFYLSIHSNNNGQPSELLWWDHFGSDRFTSRLYAEDLSEGWMQPDNGSYIFPGDSQCWQYNFYIDPEEAFEQEWDTRYWLDVQAMPGNETAKFGWKTTAIDAPETGNWARWNSDKSPWDPGYDPWDTWMLLIYGLDHPYAGQGVNFSFVITSDLQPEELDWGDAPYFPGSGGYPTLVGNNGASHIIDGPWLGDGASIPDAEADGQPDPNALGDDNDGNDDEDGVDISVLTQGVTAYITVRTGGGGGMLDAWIDWNGDKTWQHSSEQVFAGYLTDGPHIIQITPPANAVVGQSFARFRFSRTGGLLPTGPADNGEVEDYEVRIDCNSCANLDDSGLIDWGDFSVFAGSWLWSGPPGGNIADMNCDGIVNWGDFSVFAAQWLGSCPG